MSKKDRSPEIDYVTPLMDALDLQPQKLTPITVAQFLTELKDHPERADTAHALLVRAVEALGEVDIEKEKSPQRQQRLRMLKDLGYKLYNAFDLVRGAQRTVHEMMEHSRAAKHGGYQMFLAMIVKGPPGSGKSMLVDAFKAALEGHVVYSVKGCPVHENPINLLTLLSKKSQNRLAEQLGLTEADSQRTGTPSLKDMLAFAGKPCKHCWSKVMESCEHESDPNQALLKIEVIPQRLSARSFGISTMTPKSTLATAIGRGNRGLVDLGELFDGASNPGGGMHPALKPLLDATNDRKLLGGVGATPPAAPGPTAVTGSDCAPSNNPAGTDEVPLDTVLIGQTNQGAYESFIKSLGKDAGKLTRRVHVFNFPYNTSVTEEEMAYNDRIEQLREKPHFDPMALKLLALLAVVSRLDETNREIDLVARARIYDGEKLNVKRPSGSNRSFGDAFPGESAGATSTASNPDYWTVKDLWRQAGEKEATQGLDMTVMFNLLSEIIERALREKRFERCVSSYELLTYLRERLVEMEKSDGFTDDQKEVLKRCRTAFLAQPAKGSKDKGQIESEYRRLLIRQIYEIAAPDFERRAEESFQRYRRHSQAYAIGEKKVQEPEEPGSKRMRKVDVDVTFLNKVDAQMSMVTSEQRDQFRRSLEAKIFQFTRDRRDNHKLCNDTECDDIEITWRTLPDLADAIRRMLNSETQQRLERLLKKPMELPDESDEDKQLRQQVFVKFAELGYCPHCSAQALEYFKLNELWSVQS